MFFNINKFTLLKLSIVMLAFSIAGCQPAPKPNAGSSSDHGHDHADGEPETVADAVKELEGVCKSIKDAFAKNDADAAHGPLHDVGHLLEDTKALIEKSSFDAAVKAELESARKSLFEAFSAVDLNMHGDGGKKYPEVADAIDAALKSLIEKSKI